MCKLVSSKESMEAHLKWVKELNASGYAGITKLGEIVDRREHRNAVPIQENKKFGIAPPKTLEEWVRFIV